MRRFRDHPLGASAIASANRALVVQHRNDRPVITTANHRKLWHAISEPAEAATNIYILKTASADAQRVATATDRGFDVGLFDQGLQKRVRDPALVGANGGVVAKRHGHGDLSC